MAIRSSKRKALVSFDDDLTIHAVARLLEAINTVRADPAFWSDTDYRIVHPTCREYMVGKYRDIPGHADLEDDLKVYAFNLILWATKHMTDN